MEKYNQRVLTIVTIVTVLILVIIFAGVTYAFFTANNPEGSTAQIISDTGRMLITYDDGTDSITPVTNIQPSNTILVNKTFTLTGSNTTVGTSSSDGLTMSYKVGVQYTSTFSDDMMHYYIKEVNRPANSNVTTNYVIKPEEGKTESDYKNQTVQGNDAYTGYVHGTFKKGNNKYAEMVTGEFPASLNDQTITFNLIIQFPDNNENQDSEKGKTFNGKVVINQNQYLNDYIADLDKTENGLEIDDTNDKNLRYVGASPNNYIKFNDETWRLIGILNVYNVETNNYENLVKIVRNNSLGNYSLDTSDSLINSGKGINEWNQADLMYELNCDGESTKYCREDVTDGYLSNLTSGTTKWYNGLNNAKNGTYDYSKNIKNNYLDKIANVRWILGGNLAHTSSVQQYYENERGTVHVSDPTDGITRKDYWDGMIALLYASDYGYASTNIACRKSLSSNVSGIFNCSNDNWLFNNVDEWLLSSRYGDSENFFKIDRNGGVSYYYISNSFAIRPVLFLKSFVTISGGNGTLDNPYIID